MAKKRSVKSVIGIVIGGGIAILILYAVACLYLDEIRAKYNASQLYPDAEILAVETNNQIFTGDAAVMLYDKEHQIVFLQRFTREWIFFNEADNGEHGYSNTVHRRQALNDALTKFDSKTETEHLRRYYPDGNGVLIFTKEDQFDALEKMYNDMFDAVGQLQQPFSIVCCNAEEYDEVAKRDNEELTRGYAKLQWFGGEKTIVPSVEFLPKILHVTAPYAEFNWQSRDIVTALWNRENDNAEGKMLKYEDFVVESAVELYYEYSDEIGEKRGVRQWAHSSNGSGKSYHFN